MINYKNYAVVVPMLLHHSTQIEIKHNISLKILSCVLARWQANIRVDRQFHIGHRPILNTSNMPQQISSTSTCPAAAAGSANYHQSCLGLVQTTDVQKCCLFGWDGFLPVPIWHSEDFVSYSSAYLQYII